jgi:hypothetical protein
MRSVAGVENGASKNRAVQANNSCSSAVDHPHPEFRTASNINTTQQRRDTMKTKY